MTTYCAPCITELALVREATTAVAGSASCTAHAVLLAHPEDLPGRRRQRLAELRKLAEAKRETASPEEQVQLELLVHEYTLAGAMDMTPAGQGRGQGHGQGHRGPGGRPLEGRGGERGERPGEADGERGPRPGKSRRGRGRGEGVDGSRPGQAGVPGVVPGAEGGAPAPRELASAPGTGPVETGPVGTGPVETGPVDTGPGGLGTVDTGPATASPDGAPAVSGGSGAAASGDTAAAVAGPTTAAAAGDGAAAASGDTTAPSGHSAALPTAAVPAGGEAPTGGSPDDQRG